MTTTTEAAAAAAAAQSDESVDNRPGMNHRSKEEDDEEEDQTTLSWTSSLVSTTPDPPLFCRSSEAEASNEDELQLQQERMPEAQLHQSKRIQQMIHPDQRLRNESGPLDTLSSVLPTTVNGDAVGGALLMDHPVSLPESDSRVMNLLSVDHSANPEGNKHHREDMLDASPVHDVPPTENDNIVSKLGLLCLEDAAGIETPTVTAGLPAGPLHTDSTAVLPPVTCAVQGLSPCFPSRSIGDAMTTPNSSPAHDHPHRDLYQEVDDQGEPVLLNDAFWQSLSGSTDEQQSGGGLYHNENDNGEHHHQQHDSPVMLESTSSNDGSNDDDASVEKAKENMISSFLPTPSYSDQNLLNRVPLDRSPVTERSQSLPSLIGSYTLFASSTVPEDNTRAPEEPPTIMRHHGRQPSTIVEDPFSELPSPDDDDQEQKQHQSMQSIPSTVSLRSNLAEESLQNPPLPVTSGLRYRHMSHSSTNSLNSTGSSTTGGLRYSHQYQQQTRQNMADPLEFAPLYATTRLLRLVSQRVLPAQHAPHAGAATWIGFWALASVTCANYVLTPMRDAIALQVGVQHMPQLTLASTVLAVFSSVPIGWLFEAPDPGRRRVWKRMGLTRGETQGTSLALFYRCFAFVLISYAVGFTWLEAMKRGNSTAPVESDSEDVQFWFFNLTKIWQKLGPTMFIAFFLVVHLMKLHCLSLIWGVSTEAMEYEEVARKTHHAKHQKTLPMESNKMRLKRLSLVGFGGTLGGIVGSFLASSMAQILRLPGLLLSAAILLEISAQLSIELGQIMKKHWEEQQQLFQSNNDLTSLDPSMKRSSSLGSMKRISSGNSLNRVKSTSDLGMSPGGRSQSPVKNQSSSMSSIPLEKVSEDTFSQRMLRGVTTILRSRLLMAIFTYNALYASTTVLLSFQRAALVANRNSTTSVQADTAFLANINMASSAAIFALQASGIGAYVAHKCGSQGTLALMPLIRLAGVIALAWWHRFSGGQPPNLLVFLVVDECCKIMNLAVAKPVRESLWRGLSNEARYEAKPIVDTLANRWGGGSAAFLVSFVDKMLDLVGVVPDTPGGGRDMFGFPPILCLCVFIAGWWAVVSADLGLIRKNIDIELKKRQ